MKKTMTAFSMIIVLILSLGVVAAQGTRTRDNIGADSVPVAVEVAPGMFYLGKTIQNGQLLEGYSFVHYAKDKEVHEKMTVDNSC